MQEGTGIYPDPGFGPLVSHRFLSSQQPKPGPMKIMKVKMKLHGGKSGSEFASELWELVACRYFHCNDLCIAVFWRHTKKMSYSCIGNPAVSVRPIAFSPCTFSPMERGVTAGVATPSFIQRFQKERFLSATWWQRIFFEAVFNWVTLCICKGYLKLTLTDLQAPRSIAHCVTILWTVHSWSWHWNVWIVQRVWVNRRTACCWRPYLYLPPNKPFNVATAS